MPIRGQTAAQAAKSLFKFKFCNAGAQTTAVPTIAILTILLLAGSAPIKNNATVLQLQGAGSCDSDSNCSTGLICCNTECTAPLCATDNDCNDSNPNTIDVCSNDATCESYCTNIAIQPQCDIACSNDQECDDSNPATTDICNNDGACESSCSHAKTEPSCAIACSNDADCDDGKQETIDTCNNKGTCESSCTNIEQKTEIELPRAEQGETKSKRFGNKTMTLHKSRKNFAANDVPSLSVSILAQDGTPADAQVEAFLTLPDGSVKQIDAKRIKKAGNGKFTVEAAMPRSFKAGTYSITVRASDGTETAEETISFEWGLIAVNTMKSIYRPGETAQFEIVVLDKESYGVSGAEVTLTITLPDNSTALLSTANSLVKETTTKGIYVADFTVSAEGTYIVQANAKSTSIDTTIQTTFEARQNFAYDIVRRTGTKVDPARQPNLVEIDLTAMQGQRVVDVRETVPKEFQVSVKKAIAEETSEGETTEKIIDDPRVKITETEDEKIIEWKNIEFDTEGKAQLQYSYGVPDKKPWLYNLGPIEVIGKGGCFFEARQWMIAVDASTATKLFFRTDSDVGHPGPDSTIPNDANCSIGCPPAVQPALTIYYSSANFAVQDINSLSDTAGTATYTKTSAALPAPKTNKGILKFVSFVSPPLASQQTIAAGGTWTAGVLCYVSTTTNMLHNPAYVVYRWIKATDSNGERITNFFLPAATVTSCGQTASPGAMKPASVLGNFSSITFARGDRIVIEVDINSAGSATNATRTITFAFNNNTTPNDGNLTMPFSVRFAGDVNAGILKPDHDSNSFANGAAFDVNVFGTCKNYDCGDTNVTLQYCITPSGCATYFDMNTVPGSPLYISGSTASRREDLMSANDTNAFVFSVIGSSQGYYAVRAKIDSNWSQQIRYSYENNADINLTIGAALANNVPDANIWKVHNQDFNAALPSFSYSADGNLTIKFRTSDADSDDLNFNMWQGTTANAKTNKIIGDINLSTNANRGACDTNAKTGMVCNWDWNISGIADNNYWITIEINDGTDTNTISSERSFHVNPAAADLTFAIFLPAFGCTQGEGSYANNATGTCDKCFFDGNGSYNQNKIACQGQVDAAAGPSFFFFDNQSTSSTALTWKMDLNAALPATLKLKMSQAFNGWQGTCTAGANPSSGCIDVNDSSQAQLGSSIAVAVDLNAWSWADFVGVTAGSVDRNATSESLAS